MLAIKGIPEILSTNRSHVLFFHLLPSGGLTLYKPQGMACAGKYAKSLCKKYTSSDEYVFKVP